MKWNAQQERALDAAGNWLRDGEGPFRLFGYAGTGKTTLAKHLAAGVEGQVLYAAYTGKAADVMRSAGCDGATTLHSLLYKPREKGRARLKELERLKEGIEQRIKAAELNKGGGSHGLDQALKNAIRMIEDEKNNVKSPAFTLNPDSPIQHASLLVVDEVSMIPESMGDDILSFGTPVLCLGDPGQLPPVKGRGYFTQSEPDFMLTEIMRQAKDNPIIDLATRIRTGRTIPKGSYGESQVIAAADFDPKGMNHDAQLLVGTNKRRRRANLFVRGQRHDLSGDPVLIEGDRLVCLRNDHEAGLLNGAIYNVARAGEHDTEMETVAAGLDKEGSDESVWTVMHTAHLLGQELEYYSRMDAHEFDYGYALTVHKSQGSQWDEVVLMDESRTFKNAGRQWLYTGVTRAAKKITIVV